jgi:hypothetical protein
MRSLVQVNGRQFVRVAVEVVQKIRFAQLHAVMLLLAIAITAIGSVSLLAEEGAEGTDGSSSPGRPQIINFQVSWDGINQYFICGQVVGVDNPENLQVNFGDYISGATTWTTTEGYFDHLVFLDHAENETYSATVTSHDGVESDRASDWVW